MKSDITPDMNPGRARKFEAVEEEFGEPFWQVVRGFAEMGYGRKATARILGYSWVSFSRLARSRADIHWPTVRDAIIKFRMPKSEAWRANVTASNRRRAKHRYYVCGQWCTVAEIARQSSVSRSGILRRIYRGIRGDRLSDPALAPSERGRLGARTTNSRRRKARAWWVA